MTAALLIRYHATGNAVTGVSGGVGLHVVSLRMDDQRRATVAEDGVAITWSPIHIFIDDPGLRLAISVHGDVLHIASMMTLRILQSVLFVVRIEVRAGRFEIWRVALWILVDVNGVLSWRQIVQVEFDHHAIAVVHEGGTDALALSVFQFDRNFRSAGG